MLLSHNFAYAKFQENKNLPKISESTIVDHWIQKECCRIEYFSPLFVIKWCFFILLILHSISIRPDFLVDLQTLLL